MAAFGPVLGFLLGAYLLSFHMDSLSKIISIGKTHYSYKIFIGGCCLILFSQNSNNALEVCSGKLTQVNI